MMTVVLALMATIIVYCSALKLHQKYPYTLLNPVLISIIVLSGGLLLSGIPYATYNQGGQWLTRLLEPAVVALGVPLYQQLKPIRRDLPALLLVIGCSAALAIVSTVVLAVLLGADQALAASLAPRSVTTPIAIAVAVPLGGEGALAALGVLITGLFGAMFGVPLLKILGIRSAKAQGVAIGTASHALGTSVIMKQGEQQGAYSALALVLCAIITALLAPVMVPWLLDALNGAQLSG